MTAELSVSGRERLVILFMAFFFLIRYFWGHHNNLYNSTSALPAPDYNWEEIHQRWPHVPSSPESGSPCNAPWAPILSNILSSAAGEGRIHNSAFLVRCCASQWALYGMWRTIARCFGSPISRRLGHRAACFRVFQESAWSGERSWHAQGVTWASRKHCVQILSHPFPLTDINVYLKAKTFTVPKGSFAWRGVSRTSCSGGTPQEVRGNLSKFREVSQKDGSQSVENVSFLFLFWEPGSWPGNDRYWISSRDHCGATIPWKLVRIDPAMSEFKFDSRNHCGVVIPENLPEKIGHCVVIIPGDFPELALHCQNLDPIPATIVVTSYFWTFQNWPRTARIWIHFPEPLWCHHV